MPIKKPNAQKPQALNTKKKRNKIYIGIALLTFLVLCISLLTQHNALSQALIVTDTYETRIKEALEIQNNEQQKEELTKIQNELTNTISTTQNEIIQTQKEIEHAEELKNELTSLSSHIDEAQDIMFKAQEHALNIGKFTCKVNSCQNDPSHKNYPAFIKATDDLVIAKDNLQKAKDTYKKAKKTIANKSQNESKLNQLNEKLTNTNKALQFIKTTYLTK